MSFKPYNNVIPVGIDALQVGTVVVFKLPSITDKNIMGYQPLESVLAKDVKKVKKVVDKTEPLVGIIKRKIETGDFPVFDVAFFTRYNGGAISGYLELKEIMIWRYFANPANSGKPPKWFKKAVLASSIKHGEFAGIPANLIHYLKPIKDKAGFSKLVSIVKHKTQKKEN